MAVSMNSVSVFNSAKLQGKCLHVPRSGIGPSSQKDNHFTSPSGIVGLRRSTKGKKRGLCLLVGDDDRVATDASSTSSGNAETPDPEGPSSSATLPSPVSPIRSQFQTTLSEANSPEDVNVSVVSPNLKSAPKRSSLTVREKLRAARVLSRYAEPKASTKSALGSNVLDALRESDKGKKSGFPEAPTNLFDDSKRGMPKPGLTFELPGGVDVFIIAVSFVLISTLMFATTYFVWKVGAIHFNEY